MGAPRNLVVLLMLLLLTTDKGKWMNVSEAFVDTIKYDKSEIFNAFVREDIKAPVVNAGESAVSLAKRVQAAGEKIKEDGIKKTYDNTKESVIASATSLGNWMQTTGKKIKEDGVKKTYENTKDSVTASTKSLANITKKYGEAFDSLFDQLQGELGSNKSTEEKTFYILRVLSYFTSFLAGVYLGRALPDKDIEIFGIGKHRHIATHSIVPILLVKLLAKLMFRVVDATYIKVGDHRGSGKKNLALIKDNLWIMAGGMSLGMAVHLLQDGILEPSGTIRGPGFNTFISGTTLDDQAFLVVNAFFSLLFGKKFIADTSGK